MAILEVCCIKDFVVSFFLCSPLFGEDFQFDEHIFQMGWNHQPDRDYHQFTLKFARFAGGMNFAIHLKDLTQVCNAKITKHQA